MYADLDYHLSLLFDPFSIAFVQAASFGGSNIDPTAWEDKKCKGESRFPAQVEFVMIKKALFFWFLAFIFFSSLCLRAIYPIY